MNLIVKKQSDKPKLRDILQNNWPILSKNISVKKKKMSEQVLARI